MATSIRQFRESVNNVKCGRSAFVYLLLCPLIDKVFIHLRLSGSKTHLWPREIDDSEVKIKHILPLQRT